MLGQSAVENIDYSGLQILGSSEHAYANDLNFTMNIVGRFAVVHLRERADQENRS